MDFVDEDGPKKEEDEFIGCQVDEEDELEIDDLLEAVVDEEIDKERGDYEVKEKVVLKRRPKDLFNVLPDNWIEVTHDSGLVLYLHRASRVVTFSRPYFLGEGSARHHKVPQSAIPCYYQRKLVEEELKTIEDLEAHRAMVSASSDEPNNDDVICKINAPLVKIKDSNDMAASDLTPAELHAYAQKAFDFETISIRRYKDWGKARKHFKERKKLKIDRANLMNNVDRPTLPSDTKLITVPVIEGSNKPTMREFCLNPKGKSALSVLHEYVQKVLSSHVQYDFIHSPGSCNPFFVIAKIQVTSSASAKISESSNLKSRLAALTQEYEIRLTDSGQTDKLEEKLKDMIVIGNGKGMSKKAAKMNAAVDAMGRIIPSIKFNDSGVAIDSSVDDEEQLQIFHNIEIDDTRIPSLSTRTGQPLPYMILQECLSKCSSFANCPMSIESKKVAHSKVSFKLKLGDMHESEGISSNSAEAKQIAAQKMLQKLYPNFKTYDQVLRLYGMHVRQNLKEIRCVQKEFQKKNTASRSSVCKAGKRVEQNETFLRAVKEHMTKYAEKACGKSDNIVIREPPICAQTVESVSEACQKYVQENGDAFMEMIPKVL